jgi:dynein heavy chain
MLLSDPLKIVEPERIIRLWIHECERTYGDRLVSYEHLKTYREGMFDIVKKSFQKFNFSKFFSGATPENLIYNNFTLGIGADRYYD